VFRGHLALTNRALAPLEQPAIPSARMAATERPAEDCAATKRLGACPHRASSASESSGSFAQTPLEIVGCGTRPQRRSGGREAIQSD